MRTRTKIRILLSFIILALSTVLFVSYCVNSFSVSGSATQTDVKPASTVVPTKAPVEQQPVTTAVPKEEKELPWSLLLVNGNIPLPEDYSFVPVQYENETVDKRMYSSLVEMLDTAKAEGLTLWLASGYRDRETQKVILNNAIENRMNSYGMAEEEARENALLTIALPGYSEHETGLAIDFNYVNQDFESTAEYAWLSEHAREYGFVQRYPKGKEEITGINVEPWHYRYVGRKHAKKMQELELTLEEYVEYMKTA